MLPRRPQPLREAMFKLRRGVQVQARTIPCSVDGAVTTSHRGIVNFTWDAEEALCATIAGRA